MPDLDPVTREIMRNSLACSADEMAVALYRTAYSTIVRDCLDYSTSLCDERGRMIAQGVTIPLHLGSVPYAMDALFRRFGDDIAEGDVFIMNDPFDGGMHIPDIFIIKPVFWEGERAGFAVSTAHQSDLGGRVPGSSACDNVDIFQDGFRIPWLKLYRQGVPDESIFALLETNVRTPRITVGDIRAEISACNIGERALHDLIERYGLAVFRACADDLIEYTAQRVRAEIATWPEGSYSFTDYMDTDGVGGPRVRIQVKLTVSGGELTADFTGSSPQVRGSLNCTYSYVAAAVALCVRTVMREEVPNTAGLFEPLHVIAPEGSVLNVKMPGASSMRGITGFRVVDVVFGALAQILPGRVFAAGEGGNTLVIIGGQREEGRPFVYYELISGTWGGRPGLDGVDGICNIANITSNVPIEQAEAEYPVRIERYGFVPDTGGAGEFRGGLSVEREWRLLTGEAHLVVRSDRREHLPYGLEGGGYGAPSLTVLRHADGSSESLPTMISTSMNQGDRIHHRMASGGGYGDPLRRNPELVAQDVRNEFLSIEAARTVYGVAFDDATGAVDVAATELLRARPAS
jgi:N-methylhydantoinase B